MVDGVWPAPPPVLALPRAGGPLHRPPVTAVVSIHSWRNACRLLTWIIHKLHLCRLSLLRVDNVKVKKNIANFYEYFRPAWIIHKQRLLQMQGTAHEAVRMYRKWVVTKQMG